MRILKTSFLIVTLFFTTSSYSSTSELTFAEALQNSKSIVVGTYVGKRYGKTKKKRKTVTKHIFKDVTVYRKRRTLSRKRFVVVVRGGIDVEFDALIPRSNDNELTSEDSAASVEEAGDVEFYEDSEDALIPALVETNEVISIDKYPGALPDFVNGTKYMFLTKKKKGKKRLRVSPIHQYVFTVNNAGLVSNTNNIPLLSVADGNLIFDYDQRTPGDIELIESDGGDVIIDSNSDYAVIDQLDESEFVRSVVDKLGVKK